MKLKNRPHWCVILWADYYLSGDEWLFGRHITLENAVRASRRQLLRGWQVTIAEVAADAT